MTENTNYRVVLEKPDYDRVIILDEGLAYGVALHRAQMVANTFYNELASKWTVKVEGTVPHVFQTVWTPTPKSKW
ncbi:hypothetical protein [uncultured Mediterranean phage]|nr:hypothetical protein [uncultured Mediterranean phage]